MAAGWFRDLPSRMKPTLSLRTRSTSPPSTSRQTTFINLLCFFTLFFFLIYAYVSNGLLFLVCSVYLACHLLGLYLLFEILTICKFMVPRKTFGSESKFTEQGVSDSNLKTAAKLSNIHRRSRRNGKVHKRARRGVRWESIDLEHPPTLKTPEIYPKIKGISSDSSKFATVKNREEKPNISEAIISKYLQTAFRYFFAPVTVVVDKHYGGINLNQLCKAAEVYLRTKISPATGPFKVGKTPKQKSLNVSVGKGGEIIDRFDNNLDLKLRFISVKRQNQNGYGNEERFFELSFNKRYRDTILNEYLPFVLAKSMEIKDNADDDSYGGGMSTESELCLVDSTTMISSTGFDAADNSAHCVREYRSGLAVSLSENEHQGQALKRERITKENILGLEDLQQNSGGRRDDAAKSFGKDKAVKVFLRDKEFYKRIGWKRGYFLYDSPGTDRPSLIAVMANSLESDIYDLDPTCLSSISNLPNVLVSINNRSLIAIKDFDHWVEMLPNLKNELMLSGLLRILNGLLSSCGNERIIVLTTNHDHIDRVDAALLHPLNIDSYISTSSRQHIDLPNDGGEIVWFDSAEQQSSVDFEATNIRAYQRDVLVPTSKEKNMIEASRRQCMHESILSLVDSTTLSSTDFDAPDNSAHLVMAYQSGPILFNSQKKDTGEGLNRECLNQSVLSLYDSSKQKSLLDVDATENKAHLVRAYQSCHVVSLSESKNRGEELKRECITKSILGLEDLQQNSGGRRAGAAKSFGKVKAVNVYTRRGRGCWHSIKPEEPATFAELGTDPENVDIISDLLRFVRDKEFYKRMGRARKRGYLLYNSPGIDRSKLVSVMANCLEFDFYDLDPTGLSFISELTHVLVSTNNCSLIAIKDFVNWVGMLPNLKNEAMESLSWTDFDALDNSAHLVRAYESDPILFNSEKKDTRDGLNRECLTKSVLSLDDSSKHKSLPDVDARENKVHLVRAYQSCPVVSLSDNNNRGEALKRDCVSKSILSLEDLQHHSGGRPDNAANNLCAIYDAGIHTPHSLAQNFFEVREALPTLKQPNDCVPLLSLGRLTLQGCVQEEKSQDLPRFMKINGAEQRATKSSRYLGGLTAQSTSFSRWPVSLPDGRHIALLNPLEQSTKNVAHVARVDQCSPTVPLHEKKMVRRTLKRKYRIVSVLFEIHQQPFGKRCEGAAKSFRATRMRGKHGINRASTVKRIHKQRRINQWPFRQKWATRKVYSLREKRSYEVSSLSMDEKLVSRFLFIHMSQFPRSSPRPLALPNGSESVGPIALLSNEFAATNNGVHLVRQNQSGSTTSHYERKNTRETLGRQRMTESLSNTEDLQQHFGCKHKDAVKRLGVKVSIFKSSCRQHWVYWLPCQIKKNGQEAFDATNDIAHLVKADQGIPTVSYSEMENKREALKREYSGISFEDLPQHYGGRHEYAMNGIDSLPLGEQSIIRYFAQRRTLTHNHCVQRKKSQDLPRGLQMDCLGGLAAQSAIGLPDGGYILSLSEKKIVGKTLKRKCRTTSVFSLEDHQQHGVRRWEDAAKSLGRKRICRQLVIPYVSREKRIYRQHVIHRWSFQQAYSIGDNIPIEVFSLSTDGKLVSRLRLAHIPWLRKFVPRPSALPAGGEIVGPISLLSREFGATNTRAHVIRQDQSGSSASHSEEERPGEPEDVEGTGSGISLEELQQLFDMKRDDAAKILKVSVSTLKRMCRQHGIKPWPYQARTKALKKPPDRHRGMSTTRSSNDRRNFSASQEEPLLRGHVSGPIYRTISSCTDPTPGQPTPIVPHPTGNLLASEEEVLLWGHVSGPIYGTISSCTEPAPSQPTPIVPHPTEDLEDQRNLLALPEEPLLSQITPTGPPTMDGFADWSAVSALFNNSFPEGHASGSIDCTVPASSNSAPSQPTPTNATERQNMDFVELKATYGDTTIKFQLPPMFETSELKEKVSKILECELGSFKVEYKDKDGEWILMGCDENVREYLQLLNSLGKQVTKLKISDKVPNTTNLCETCGSLMRKRPRSVHM